VARGRAAILTRKDGWHRCRQSQRGIPPVFVANNNSMAKRGRPKKQNPSDEIIELRTLRKPKSKPSEMRVASY